MLRTLWENLLPQGLKSLLIRWNISNNSVKVKHKLWWNWGTTGTNLGQVQMQHGETYMLYHMEIHIGEKWKIHDTTCIWIPARQHLWVYGQCAQSSPQKFTTWHLQTNQWAPCWNAVIITTSKQFSQITYAKRTSSSPISLQLLS